MWLRPARLDIVLKGQGLLVGRPLLGFPLQHQFQRSCFTYPKSYQQLVPTADPKAI
jgi:hypothetical protein